jgi:hypothetical protein
MSKKENKKQKTGEGKEEQPLPTAEVVLSALRRGVSTSSTTSVSNVFSKKAPDINSTTIDDVIISQQVSWVDNLEIIPTDQYQANKLTVYGHIIIAAGIQFFYGLTVEGYVAQIVDGVVRDPTPAEVMAKIHAFETELIAKGASPRQAIEGGHTYLLRAMERVIEIMDDDGILIKHSLREWISLGLSRTLPAGLILPINLARNCLEIVGNAANGIGGAITGLESITGQMAYGTDPWYRPVIREARTAIAGLTDNLTVSEAVVFGILAAGFISYNGPARTVTGVRRVINGGIYCVNSMVDVIAGLMASALTSEALESLALPGAEGIKIEIKGEVARSVSDSSSMTDVQLMDVLQKGFNTIADRIADSVETVANEAKERTRRLALLLARRTGELFGIDAHHLSASSRSLSTLSSSAATLQEIQNLLPIDDPTNIIINQILRQLEQPCSLTEGFLEGVPEGAVATDLTKFKKQVPIRYDMPVSAITASSGPGGGAGSIQGTPMRGMSSLSSSSARLCDYNLDILVRTALRTAIEDLIINLENLQINEKTRGGNNRTKKNKKQKAKKIKKNLRKFFQKIQTKKSKMYSKR